MTPVNILVTTMNKRIPILYKSVLAITLLAFAANSAIAQSCNIERKVPAKALTEVSFKRLNDIYEDIGEEKYNEAAKDLQDMLGRAKNDTYEQAIIHQALAQVEWARERFDSALRHFEQAVNLNTLPNHAHFALMYQIAQLYFMKERYQESLNRLDLWFCTVPKEQITSGAYVLKASIYANREDYRQTLAAIEQAIAMDSDPKEAWYQLKLASHFELEQFPQAGDTLKVMIQKWSDKKTYWTQLSSIYVKLKRDKEALSVLAAAHLKGLLDKESDIKQLANLYQFLDIPYKAAEIMEKGMTDGLVAKTQKHYEQTGDAWYQAEELENALESFKSAGRLASDGKIDLRRGYILVDLERWADAKEALGAALSKGGIEDRKIGETYLLKGMAEYNLGNVGQARRDFSQATRYERSRAPAQQWINHLNQESGRQAP